TEPIDNSTYTYQVNSTINITTTRGYFTDFICLSNSANGSIAEYPNIIASSLGNLHVAWIQATNASFWEIIYQNYGELPLPTNLESGFSQQTFNVSLMTHLKDLTMTVDCLSSTEVLHFLSKSVRNYSSTLFEMEEKSELVYFHNGSGAFTLEKVVNGHKQIEDSSLYINPLLHTAGILYLSTSTQDYNDLSGDLSNAPHTLRLIEQRGSDFGTQFNATASLVGQHLGSVEKTITHPDNTTEDISVIQIQDARKSTFMFLLINSQNESRDFNLNLDFQPCNGIQIISSPDQDSPQFFIEQMTSLENRILDWEFEMEEGLTGDLALQFYSSETFIGEFVFHVEIEIRFKISANIIIFGSLLLLFSGIYWHYQRKF
ncbi:MAG: hypothetical protein KAR20_17665, partial [Candidatus Heimdallarchaeota archaeon]|nr:hypothetical protein [Candidatus Heimdallarchaeota archaeon]